MGGVRYRFSLHLWWFIISMIGKLIGGAEPGINFNFQLNKRYNNSRSCSISAAEISLESVRAMFYSLQGYFKRLFPPPSQTDLGHLVK